MYTHYACLITLIYFSIAKWCSLIALTFELLMNIHFMQCEIDAKSLRSQDATEMNANTVNFSVDVSVVLIKH